MLRSNKGRTLSKRPAGKSPAAKTEEKPLSFPTSVQEEIEREVGPLLPQGQREQIVMRLTRVMTSEMFSGPIAHPRHMREYEEILPGSAERIIAMAEKAQSHNQAMENKIIDGTIKISAQAMYLGFLALLILIGGAIYAGTHGNNILAGILLTGGVLTGATSLIRGWTKPSNGKPEKRS